jgi:hypothetical protein
MLYDDMGGPLSNLTKTGSHQVTLSVGHTYTYKAPSIACSYNYTVGALPMPRLTAPLSVHLPQLPAALLYNQAYTTRHLVCNLYSPMPVLSPV